MLPHGRCSLSWRWDGIFVVSPHLLLIFFRFSCCHFPPCGTFVRLPGLITRSYDLNLRTNTRYVGVPFPTTCCDRRSCSVRRITSRLVGSSPCICVCAKSYSVFPLRLSACKNWLIFLFFCLLLVSCFGSRGCISSVRKGVRFDLHNKCPYIPQKPLIVDRSNCTACSVFVPRGVLFVLLPVLYFLCLPFGTFVSRARS